MNTVVGKVGKGLIRMNGIHKLNNTYNVLLYSSWLKVWNVHEV